MVLKYKVKCGKCVLTVRRTKPFFSYLSSKTGKMEARCLKHLTK